MKNPWVSIIVPVYNAEKFLPRCINSILAQTFTDFELLLIDDGSTDKSAKICDEYAQKDIRIKVFHKKNGGVSTARNLGIDKAGGEWITFVDSDDYVLNEYLESMISSSYPPATLVFSTYVNVGNNPKQYVAGTYRNNDMVKYIIKNRILDMSGPYAKLYNTEIIRKKSIRFPVGINMAEDGIFLTIYLNAINNLVIINKCNYLVVTTDGSLSSKYYSFDSEWKCFLIWKSEISKLIRKYSCFQNPQKIIWDNRIAETFLRCLHCAYILQNIKFKERLKFLKNIPDEEYNEFFNYYQSSSFKDKFLTIILKKRFYTLYILLGKFLLTIKVIK